jgi:hypothetical protein
LAIRIFVNIKAFPSGLSPFLWASARGLKHPRPSAEELQGLRPGTTDISTINLAAIWSTHRALGHSRLIMSGVMMHLNFDRRWILAAIPRGRHHRRAPAGFRTHTD